MAVESTISGSICPDCGTLIPNVDNVRCICTFRTRYGSGYAEGYASIGLPESVGYDTQPANLVVRPGTLKSQQAAHWVKLHEFSPKFAANWDASEAKAWFNIWNKSVPGCSSCGSPWATYVKDNPPDFANPHSFFEWSVTAHNYVSTEHVKPAKEPMTMATAYQRYWHEEQNYI